MRFFLLTLAALSLGTGTARAADLSTLGCVADKMQAPLKAQVEADVTRNLTELARRPSYDPSVASGLSVVAQECAGERKWSDAAASAAATYALAKLALPIAQRVLSEKGFDPALLEAQFQALPEEARNRPLTAEEMQGLVRDSVTDEAQQTRENAALLNQFFSMVNTLQYASFRFAAA